MKKNTQKTLFARGLTVVLIAALALTLTACKNPFRKEVKTRHSDATAHYDNTAPQKIGTGQTEFAFQVVDLDGKQTDFTVCTDEKTVGAALMAVNLIAGEPGDYGLYIKTVNGITADYEKDGCYWAFYVNGKYASAGVDQTEIDPDDTYRLKVEKG